MEPETEKAIREWLKISQAQLADIAGKIELIGQAVSSISREVAEIRRQGW